MTTSLTSALERLYRRGRMGIKLGLDNVHALLAELDNPETSFGTVHVAGTNGKGSVCAMIDSVLRAAGYRVGMYTSPHLVAFNERVRVDGKPLSDRDLRSALESVEAASDRMAAAGREEPTFFECSTALAFLHFKAVGVKLAVVETGMGGRLDATNVAMSLLSVITPVTLEHTQHLGADIATIAGEKAGIIKEGRPVVCSAMDEEAFDVIRRTAAQRHAPLANVAEHVTARVLHMDLSGQKVRLETSHCSYGTLHLPLLGAHQVQNLATAILAIDTLRDVVGLEVDREAVGKGIADVRWDGRFQILSTDPVVVLDCAHNPGAAHTLVDTLTSVVGGRPLALVVGMSNDKDVHGFLAPLARHVCRAWAVPIPLADRRMEPECIAEAARALGMNTEVAEVPDALDAGRSWARDTDGVLCIAGSIFLAGDVLARRRAVADE